MMALNLHVLVVVVASVAIAASVGHSVLNVVALDSVQAKWNDQSNFGFMTMLNGGVIDICNTAPVPASFNGLSVIVYYRGQEAGRFDAGGTTVQPNSATSLTGRGDVTGLAGDIFSAYVDAELTRTSITGTDANDMTAVMIMKTAVIGVIPFDVSKEYGGREFFDMMNDKHDKYSC